MNALRPIGGSELEVITASDNAQGHAVYRANGFKDEKWSCLARQL